MRSFMLAGALSCALAVTAAVPATAGARCRSAHKRPAVARLDAARVATLCMVNVVRRRAGLEPVHTARSLRLAADGHAQSMAAGSYLSHTEPSGATLLDRVTSTGLTSFDLLGENLYWGQRRVASPAAAVRAWMRSPGHRAILLGGQFRQAGIGIARGLPPGVPGHAFFYALDLAA
jgi:uncharacterized protein YkwD